MRILTLMEMSTVRPEDRARHERLAELWIDRVWRHGATSIEILYAKEYPKAVEGLADLVKVDYCPDVPMPEPSGLEHEASLYLLWCALKLYNICRQTEPFLWLDWDAVPISDLGPIWEIRNEKPLIACGHQQCNMMDDWCRELGLTLWEYLNGGVMVVSDPTFLKWPAMLEQNRSNGKVIGRYPDDILMSVFCAAQRYDFTHPVMHNGWNAWSKFTQLRYEGNNRWHGTTQDDDGEFHQAHVVHYYAKGAKPWVINCPLYAYHSGRKILPYGHHPLLRQANREPQRPQGRDQLPRLLPTARPSV